MKKIKEWLGQIWPPLLAWLVGIGLSFVPLGIKQLLYRMLGVPVKAIFLDIEVLYICITGSTVVICYVMQEKFKKGNKTLLVMNAFFIAFGAIVYALCKFGEIIAQKWPFIEVNEIEDIWPGFIKIFFIIVSLLNMLSYVLLPVMNLPEKVEMRSKT